MEIHPKRLKCCSRNRDDLSCLKPFLLLIAKCEGRLSSRLFPHYAPVSKHKQMRTRLGWTISYKSLYFVHPSLELVPLFTGMRERSTVLKVHLLDVIIHSQIVGGWNELKKASVFLVIFCVPLKCACFTCLDLWSLIHHLNFYRARWCSQVATETKRFSWDQNFRN